jgi:hypothetical protein
MLRFYLERIIKMKTVKATNNKGKTLAMVKLLREGLGPIIDGCGLSVRYYIDVDDKEYLIYQNRELQITNMERIVK